MAPNASIYMRHVIENDNFFKRSSEQVISIAHSKGSEDASLLSIGINDDIGCIYGMLVSICGYSRSLLWFVGKEHLE